MKRIWKAFSLQCSSSFQGDSQFCQSIIKVRLRLQCMHKWQILKSTDMIYCYKSYCALGASNEFCGRKCFSQAMRNFRKAHADASKTTCTFSSSTVIPPAESSFHAWNLRLRGECYKILCVSKFWGAFATTNMIGRSETFKIFCDANELFQMCIMKPVVRARKMTKKIGKRSVSGGAFQNEVKSFYTDEGTTKIPLQTLYSPKAVIVTSNDEIARERQKECDWGRKRKRA